MFLPRPAVACRFSLALLGAVAITGGAAAQSTGASATNARLANLESQSADVSVRNPEGAAVVPDGQVQAGADESTFTESASAGAGDMVAGVGAGGGASVIGSDLQMVAPANTVIANSDQSHPGAVAAGPTH